ncbi:MAG: cation transporter [Idiomarina sp.]|nr:cation transporter [Idiomarina sp.]
MLRSYSSEDRLILISAMMALGFAIGGIGIGLWLQSSIIIFDGVYSFISLGLSLISLVAGRYIRRVNETKYPFGKSIIQPITLVFKYLAILVLCSVSIVEGVQTLLGGGRLLNFEQAFVYSAVVTLLCFAAFRFLQQRRRADHSDLLLAEQREWLMDTGLSLMLTLGFALAIVAQWFGYAGFALLIDPLMLILAALFFIRIPIRGILDAGKEVVGLKVAEDLELDVRLQVEEIVLRYGFKDYYLRLQKVGSTVYLEIDFIVYANQSSMSILQQDIIRHQLYDQIKDFPYRWWYTVSFTADERWAR